MGEGIAGQGRAGSSQLQACPMSPGHAARARTKRGDAFVLVITDWLVNGCLQDEKTGGRMGYDKLEIPLERPFPWYFRTAIRTEAVQVWSRKLQNEHPHFWVINRNKINLQALGCGVKCLKVL